MCNELSRDLSRLCNAGGAAGLDEVARVAIELLEPLCDAVWQDAMGNVLAVRCGDSETKPTLMLQAHMDEIGLLVTDVDDLGFIHVAAAGGIDRRVLATQPVLVHGEDTYNGVFCSVPPHLLKDEKKLPELADMGIDMGMDAAVARDRIPLGSRVTFAPNYCALNESVVTSKALDDRAGMMAIIHCLRLLKDTDVNVSVAFCVQEELGCRGAAVAARRLDPRFALVTDVSFATAPGEKPQECGKLGGGVMIGHSPILDSALTQLSIRVAKTAEKPYQDEVMGGRTGTDADVISNCNYGIRTGLLSIPLRYMHTPNETADLRDIAAVGELMAGVAKEVGSLG